MIIQDLGWVVINEIKPNDYKFALIVSLKSSDAKFSKHYELQYIR